MELNTKTNDNVGYTGKVSIRLKNKTKPLIFKNEGTLQLGSLIADILSGSSTAINSLSSRVPQWIGFEVMIGEQYVPLLNRQVPFTAIVTGDSVQDNNPPQNVIGKIQFTATIMNIAVIVRTGLGQSYRLKMLNSSGEALAYIYDNRSSGQNQLELLYNALKGGQDALIDWIMYFSNSTT